MTDQPTGGISRVPYCTKVRYGISGAPVLTDDDMDGSHAPGVGVRPTLIELVYSQPRDGKPASVSAAVTGEWMRFGQRDGGEVTTHFAGSVEGWPTWLAEEARLHDPDAVPVSSPPPDQTAEELATARATNRRLNLRAQALESELAAYRRAVAQWKISETGTYVPLRTLAVIVKVAGLDVPDRWELHYERVERAEAELRRLAAEAPQPDTETRVGARAECQHCGEPIIYEPWFRDGRGPNPPVWAHINGPRTCGTRPIGWRKDRWPFATPAAAPVQPEADGSEPPAHIGGNADDCPACQAQGLHTINPPYECPGPDMTA